MKFNFRRISHSNRGLFDNLVNFFQEKTMKTHRIKTKLTEQGKLILDNLPFEKGDEVEVIILEKDKETNDLNLYPLKDKQPYHYDDPFEPAVPLEDWEVLR